jgi:hypothetical protein
MISTLLLLSSLAPAYAFETVGFVKEDNQRDTISLLFSCFLTIGLCVYTAIHFNIPPKNEPSHVTVLKQLKWCITGILSPEAIVYTAYRQIGAATSLRKNIEAMRNGSKDFRLFGESQVRFLRVDLCKLGANN